MLKPNGIARTTYPEEPAREYNEWIAHITSSEIVRDADAFKEEADVLWACTWFKDAETADDFKRKFDALWADFKKQIQRP